MASARNHNMRILFLKDKNRINDNIETALKQLGHKVITFDKFDYDEIVKASGKVDLFFFTRGIVETTVPFDFYTTLRRLQGLLQNIKCKKVFWFTDKVIWLSEEWMEGIIPFADYGFLNDETWVRRHSYDNIFSLHLGVQSTNKGKFRKEYEGDIAFTGNIYGPRVSFAEGFKKRYGNKFKIYNNVWGKEFADLCASVKILIAPRFPTDEFYWSDRIYKTLGVKGFMIYPRLYGMDLEDGKHYVGYSTWKELIDSIDYFLEHGEERKKIVNAGRGEVMKKYTYKLRIKELLSKISKTPLSEKIEEPEYLTMDGHQFLIPQHTKSLKGYYDVKYVMNDMAMMKMWEPNTTRLVKETLKDGDIAIDIGASVGYFTLLFARQVGEKGKVFSIEPTPHRFSYLCKNAQFNGYKDRVFPFHLAAWDKQEKVAMPPQDKNFTVQAAPIDDMLDANNIDKVDFIKIDTDGNELRVLKGLERTFKKNKDLKMVFAYSPEYIEKSGEDPKEIMKFLEKYFDHSVIEGDYGDKRGLWNLFCVRKI